MEEIDDGGSVCGAGIEIERDRELAERRGAASSMVAGLCSASSFYRRGEAGLTVRHDVHEVSQRDARALQARARQRSSACWDTRKRRGWDESGRQGRLITSLQLRACKHVRQGMEHGMQHAAHQYGVAVHQHARRKDTMAGLGGLYCRVC